MLVTLGRKRSAAYPGIAALYMYYNLEEVTY